ncbi:MAG: PEGA domain-containing protein [Deltaproteobacteria bacterium]|nr:PEGA domain-containing protein [Deltaproteobacteria bacterium]
MTKFPDRATFSERFAKFVVPDGMFVVSKHPRTPGTRLPFSVELTDGRVMLDGEGEVLEMSASPNLPPDRTGMRLKFLELTPESRTLVDEMVSSRPPITATGQYRKAHTVPIAGKPLPPLPPARGPGGPPPSPPADPGAKKTLMGMAALGAPKAAAPMHLPSRSPQIPTRPGLVPPAPDGRRYAEKMPGELREQRTPGSPYILPANPFSGVDNDALDGFVDCTLYEDTNVGFDPSQTSDSATTNVDSSLSGEAARWLDGTGPQPAVAAGAAIDSIASPRTPSFGAPPAPGKQFPPGTGPGSRWDTPIEPAALPSSEPLSIPGTSIGLPPGPPPAPLAQRTAAAPPLAQRTAAAPPPSPPAPPAMPALFPPPEQYMPAGPGPQPFSIDQVAPELASGSPLPDAPPAPPAGAAPLAMFDLPPALAPQGRFPSQVGGMGMSPPLDQALQRGKSAYELPLPVPDDMTTRLPPRMDLGQRKLLPLILAGFAVVAVLAIVIIFGFGGDKKKKGGASPSPSVAALASPSASPEATDEPAPSASASPAASTSPDKSPPPSASASPSPTPVASASPAPSASPASSPSPIPLTTGGGDCIVSVKSDREATVIIRGKKLGDTPQEVPAPCGAPLKVVISHPRYEKFEQTVTPTAGEPTVVSAALERPVAKLRISSTPPGASVRIDGKSAGTTPTTATVKGFSQMKIELSLSGYKSYSTRTYIKGRSGSVNAKLESTKKVKPQPKSRKKTSKPDL